jgi:hypothetical protein
MKKIVIVDIDGTISKVGDRLKFLQKSPKDWDSFYAASFEDEPILPIIQLVWQLYRVGYEIVFCTGRRESCREKTQEWLNEHFDYPISVRFRILMRPDKDHRHDTEVKPELIQNAGITFDSIAFVLEDRNSMVQKWRELGYTCLQVADGDF